MSIETKRLTPEQLEAHRLYARHNSLLDRIATNAIFAHIAALEAELATMRQLLVELTAGEEAGIGNNDIAMFCVYCDFSDRNGDNPPYSHTPDCPIVRGRALLEQNLAAHFAEHATEDIALAEAGLKEYNEHLKELDSDANL